MLLKSFLIFVILFFTSGFSFDSLPFSLFSTTEIENRTVLSLGSQAVAQPQGRERPLSHEKPKSLQGVGISEKLGEPINLNLLFRDEEGRQVPLSQFFGGIKPVLLTLVYFECPSLCNYHLNGLTEVFKDLDWKSGKKYTFVAISFDHKEKPPLAKQKKENYLRAMGVPEDQFANVGWHFLTGDKNTIAALASQTGFAFKWNARRKEYAHASAALALTPKGIISRYLHGIEFGAQTLKLALLEASQGKVGSLVDRFIMYCFQFDPEQNKYTLYAFNIMRLAGALTVLLLALFLIPFWIRVGRKQS